jgi:multidrug efflux pump subunit AcrB
MAIWQTIAFIFNVDRCSDYSKSDLENLVIINNGKGIITLKDIATVAIEEAKEYIKVNANGRKVY